MTAEAEPDAKGSDTQRIYLDVKGMSCGACARHIQKKLNSIEGVRATVEFSSKAATIDVDRAIGVAELCAAVEKAGYTAQQRSEGDRANADTEPAGSPSVLRHVMMMAMMPLRWLKRR